MPVHRIVTAALLTVLFLAGWPANGQEWVSMTNGAGASDSGVGIKAIVRREILDISRSSAEVKGGGKLTYNHPANLCETRDGTLIMIWNGGQSEAESGNRVWFIRRPKGGDWSEPKMLEPDLQIDAGTIYQPVNKKDAPIICGYWLGVPRRSNCALRISTDDGKSWSERIKTPLTDDNYYANFNEKRLRVDMHHPLEWPDGTLWYAAGNHHGPGRRAVITVVPPDNYTGIEPQGTPWKTIHVIPPGCENQPPVKAPGSPDAKVHPCWLVLSPDYKRLMFVTRSGNTHEFSLTDDGGKTWGLWSKFPGNIVGSRGVGAVSLDVQGGKCQGWHVQAGLVKDGLTVAISNDPTRPDSWKQVLVLNPDEKEDADPHLFQSRFDRKIHLQFTGRGSRVLKYHILDPDILIGSSDVGDQSRWQENRGDDPGRSSEHLRPRLRRS